MKDWNDMRAQWQQKPVGATFPLKRPEAQQKLWATVQRRDWLESIVGLLLAPFFAIAAVKLGLGGNWPAAAFAAFLVGAVAYIPWRLWQARKLVPTPDPQRPVREFLQQELAALRYQEQMLRSVSLWYTAPIAIGCIGMYGSVRGLGLPFVGYSLIVAVIAAFIHIVNRRAANTKFRQAAAEVESQLGELEATQ